MFQWGFQFPGPGSIIKPIYGFSIETRVKDTPMKALLFYTIAGSVIALIDQVAHASLAVTLLTSLLIPPVILLVIRIRHYY